MLSLDDCRKLLGDEAPQSDAELERIRDGMYGFVRVVMEALPQGGKGSEKIDGKAKVQDPPKQPPVLAREETAIADNWPTGKKPVRSDGIEEWIHIAAQVNSGEFHGADLSMKESLLIGLSHIDHPACRRAVALLKVEGSLMTTKKASASTANRAVLYCRVSTKEQVDNFSLGTQEKSCRDYCARNNCTVDKIFIEEANRRKQRTAPSFKRCWPTAVRTRGASSGLLYTP